LGGSDFVSSGGGAARPVKYTVRKTREYILTTHYYRAVLTWSDRRKSRGAQGSATARAVEFHAICSGLSHKLLQFDEAPVNFAAATGYSREQETLMKS
jgi:hypothetical protein